MLITVVSDLHLEFSDINIKNENNADVLILSGDIMISQDLHDHRYAQFDLNAPRAFEALGRKQHRVATYRDFLKRCSFQFPHVIYVAGNHEFYHGKFYAGQDYLRNECAKHPNVYFLERDTKVIDDVTFVGATLWTDMNKGDPLTLHAISDMMTDFRVIRNDKKDFSRLRPIDVVEYHRQSLAYFKEVIDSAKDKKVVVVGHHSPSFQSCHPNYQHDHLMNGGYHSSLEEFILDRPQIKLWTHGHTHHAFDYMIGTTRIICNPRGYQTDGYSEDSGWDPTLTVEV